jgi:subtilisin family serine protease
MMRTSTYAIITALLISLISPQSAFADVDPIQAALAKVMPELALPPSHSRLTAARAQVGANWTIENGYIGQGVSVVLMDGGIQADHVQFDGRIIAEVCTQKANETDFIWKCKDTRPISEGAGTAEAVVDLAGNAVWHGVGVSSAVLEFAPGVRIIMIKNGDALQALDWVIANAKKYNIAAVSMSFGNDGPSPRQPDYCVVPDWHERFIKMRALGVIPVAATGNGGQIAGISHPACDPLVVSVGAVTPEDTVISYSNISDRTTLLAPTGFESAYTTPDKTKKDAWFDSFNGTSASTPLVAAMMAVGRSASPNASVDELISAARSSATSIDDMVVKDLKRVNFDKFVQKLLKLKTAPSISAITSSQLTEKSVTIGWTVANSPTKVRVSVNGGTSQVFAGTNGELQVAKVSGENSVVVKVEALDSDALVSSTKELTVRFPIENLTGWCNPTGKQLDSAGPLFGHSEILGPNKTNSNLIDFGVGIQGFPSLSCTYIEFSPIKNPAVAYIGRLTSGTTDRHTIHIPQDFGTGGILRIAFIDRSGNYSYVTTHIFPENTFSTSGANVYEAELQRNYIDLQPELIGVQQKSQLISKVVSADIVTLQASLNDALAAAAAVKTSSEAVIAQQLKTIAALKSEVSNLQKNPTRITIVCVKGKLSRKVIGITPVCPSGYSLKQ